MTKQNGLVLGFGWVAGRIEQDGDNRRDVAAQIPHRVGINLPGRRTVAVASNVHRGDPVTAGGKVGELMPPRITQFRPPVYTDNKWAFS